MNDVCPVMASFSEVPQDTIYMSTTLCVLLIQSGRVHVWSAEKRWSLNVTCPTACYDHVMFACVIESRRLECEFSAL